MPAAVVTIPGSSLPTALERRFEVTISPGKIVVDGVQHEVKDGIAYEQVLAWVKQAREHPHVLGTSAAEFVSLFQRLARNTDTIIVLLPHRNLIGTHAAATAARDALRGAASTRGVQIHLEEADPSDGALGLLVAFVGTSLEAGQSVAATLSAARKFDADGTFILHVQTLDFLVKIRRASFLKSAVANALGRRPLLSTRNGTIESIGTVSTSANIPKTLVDKAVERLGPKRTVWAAITHADALARAEAVEKRLREVYDVRFSYVQSTAAALFLGVGPGAVGLYVRPIDGLPFDPGLPPKMHD
ncbi:MAG: DegV family protein [Myxococcota bacterium]